VSSFIFALSPFSQHLIHLLSFISSLPFPFTCVWSFQSSHWHVLSVLFMCILCTLRAFDPHCTRSRSFLCAFYAHLVFSIVIAHILCTLSVINPHHARKTTHAKCFRSLLALCALGVVNPCYTLSTCTQCYPSLLHAFCALGDALPSPLLNPLEGPTM